jgi:hypothetical protein
MANLYKQLRGLLNPEEPRRVGTVLSVDDAAGKTTVAALSGGQIQLIGTGVAVGARAYYRAGKLEGAAPSMPAVVIEV